MVARTRGEMKYGAARPKLGRLGGSDPVWENQLMQEEAVSMDLRTKHGEMPSVEELLPAFGEPLAARVVAFLDWQWATDLGSTYRRPGGGWNFWANKEDGQVIVIPLGESGVRIAVEDLPTLYPRLFPARAGDEGKAPAAPVVSAGGSGAQHAAARDVLAWRLVVPSAFVSLLARALHAGLRVVSGHLRTLFLLVVVCSVVLVSLAGCDVGPSGPTKVAQEQGVVSHRHRGFVSIQAYLNVVRAEYPAALVQQALTLISSSVVAMEQENWDGADVYITFLDTQPTRPGSTLALHLPAVAAWPVAPVLQATPTPDVNNVYKTAPLQQTAGAWNAQTIARYNAAVNQVSVQLDTVKASVARWAQQLSSVPIPQGVGPADIDQAIELASHRFNTYPGEKWLILASSLPVPGDTSNWYPLVGIKVAWVFTACPSVDTCRTGEDAWAGVLSAAGVGAHDHLWYDVGESQTLSNLFGTPVHS